MKRFIILCLLLSAILIFSGCSSQKNGSVNNQVPVTNSTPLTVSATSTPVDTVKDATSAPQNTPCGRNVCKEGEACCDGFCYNPYRQVCLNGKLGAFSCDGNVYDDHIKSSSFTCTGELKCPLGEASGYKNFDNTSTFCADLNYCNGKWCEIGLICCGGECLPPVVSCDRGGCWVRTCGNQITHESIDLENLPKGLRNSTISFP